MNDLTYQDTERWGARINPESRSGRKDWPAWAKGWQKEKWARSGVVVWDHVSRTIAALFATDALQILEQLRATLDWAESGLVIGEPCVKLYLEQSDRKPEPDIQCPIALDAGQAKALFDLLERNEALLRRMSETERKDTARRLAEVYQILLNAGRKKRELEQASPGQDSTLQPGATASVAQSGGRRGRRSTSAEPAGIAGPAVVEAHQSPAGDSMHDQASERARPSISVESSMEQLIGQIRAFNRERDWDQFHSPKNLAMALSVEVSEIVELFQWLTPEESRTLDEQAVSRLREEIGDVMVYLVGLADKYGIDPISAAREKLLLSAQKYPPSVVRGKAKKYTEY